MDAFTRFNRCIFEWERTLLKLVGHDLLAGTKFERNFITFAVYGLCCTFLVSIFYTFIFYDPLSKIFALLFLFLIAQVIYFFFIFQVQDFLKKCSTVFFLNFKKYFSSEVANGKQFSFRICDL